MVKVFKNVIIRRLHELVLVNMILSLPLALLCLYQGASDHTVLITLTAGTVLYMLIQWRMLRRCYYDVHHIRMFYAANLIASALFAVIQLLVYRFCSNEIYTWLFSITKFARYSEYGFSLSQSAAIFHGVVILMMLIAPIDVRRFFAEKQEP